MASASFTVGLLLRGPVRRFLEEAEWDGHIKEWKEVKGFLDSTFLLRGASEGVIKTLNDWGESVNRANGRYQGRA